MRIALLTDGITPYVMGGMQRHSFFVAKYLSKNNFKVTLIHYNSSNQNINALECFEESERKNIESIVLEFKDNGKLPGHYIRASYNYSVDIFETIKDRIKDFDFIYAKGFCGWKLLEMKKKGLECPPIAVKFHGMNMFQQQANFKSYLESLMFKKPVLFNMENADYVFSYGGGIPPLS